MSKNNRTTEDIERMIETLQNELDAKLDDSTKQVDEEASNQDEVSSEELEKAKAEADVAEEVRLNTEVEETTRNHRDAEIAIEDLQKERDGLRAQITALDIRYGKARNTLKKALKAKDDAQIAYNDFVDEQECAEPLADQLAAASKRLVTLTSENGNSDEITKLILRIQILDGELKKVAKDTVDLSGSESLSTPAKAANVRKRVSNDQASSSASKPKATKKTDRVTCDRCNVFSTQHFRKGDMATHQRTDRCQNLARKRGLPELE